MLKVTIPEKHYVGMQVSGSSKVPLGFITPWGEDAAGQKRIATVDSWVGRTRADSLPTTVIENEPMLGFKMSGDIRRGMQGGQDKWRIEDPRGFELEITSTNLSMLLADTTLEKGEILDKCVWARENGQNLLLTVESEEYVEAVRMTKIATSTASWKDVKIGNTIVLQNGITGRYLGRMHTLSVVQQDMTFESCNTIESSDKMLHVILSDQTEYTYPPTVQRELHFFASPKLSSITDQSELSVADAEVAANEAISNEDCWVSCGGYRTVLLAAANPIKTDKCRLMLVDADAPADLWNTRYHKPAYLVRMKDGKLGRPHSNYNGKNTVLFVREDLFAQGIYSLATVPTVRSHHYHGRSDSRNTVTIEVDPADVVGIHHLRLETNTKAGNTVGNLV